MSYQASTWVAEQCDVTPGEKLLLFAIANRVDENGIGFPGRERLAREACCRPETVTANMKKLVERGLVVRFERRRSNGSRTSDWIVLAPRAADRGPLQDAPPDEHPEEVADAAKSSGEESSGEVYAVGQVRKTGGPEQLEEQSEKSTSSASARDADSWEGAEGSIQADGVAFLAGKHKVDQRLVSEREMRIAAAVVSEWNRQSGHDYGLGAQMRCVVMRCRERPNADVAAHVRLVQSAWRVRWWEKRGSRPGPLAPNLVYGNERSFERCWQDAANEALALQDAARDFALHDKVWPDGRRWPQLTSAEQHHAKDAVLMGSKPWLPREPPPASPVRAVSGAGWTADSIIREDAQIAAA